MASSRPKIKPANHVNAHVTETNQRILKERVAVTTTASRGAPNDGTASKSLFSKVKLVIAPPSKILRHKGDAKFAPAIFGGIPAQEHANKSACSKDKDATRPSKIPHLNRASAYKGVSIFTKFKRVMGISKIPRLKHDDKKNVQGVPSPTHSIYRSIGGDPFAAYSDSFYSDKRAGIVAVPTLATKPVADDMQVQARDPSAALVFPPVKPLNIVKKRSVVPTHPRLRMPVISSDLGIVQVRKEITGLPPNYCVAGGRYHTTHTRAARKAIPATASSMAGQLTLNDVIEANYIPDLLPTSEDHVLRPRTCQSMFSKMKQSIRRSARSIFKPTTSRKNCLPAAPISGRCPTRPSVGRTTAFVVDIARNAPSPEENTTRKPTIFLSPARKVYRPRGSIPPISGLMTPDKCKSAHGICQLRRQGKATGLVCTCYKKFIKSRQKFANYAPAILSDIIEDRPVTFFPRRRSFNLNEGARYLLSLYLDDEVDLSSQNISQPVSEPGISSASSSSSLFVSSDPLICLSPSISVSSSSISSLDQSHDHVPPPLETVFFSASNSFLGNVSSLLEDSFDCVSLSVSGNDIVSETSLMEDHEYFSPLSILDENLESVISLSPSYSVLDDYFDNTSLSSSSSLLSLTESPESITPPVESLTGGALGSPDSVAISSEYHTASDVSTLNTPPGSLRLSTFYTKALLKKANRSARILPSTSLGLGIININDNEYFCPTALQHEITVDSIDDCRFSTPVMKPDSSRRLGCHILSVNTAASSSTSSLLEESNGSVTTRSQDNGDGLSSKEDTPTSPSSIASVDAEDSRSPRAAFYGRRLPIGVTPSLPSRRLAIYGSVSPCQCTSSVPRTSSPSGPEQPICIADALNRPAMHKEAIQCPSLDCRTMMAPTIATVHERSANAHYAVSQRTRRQDLNAPLPF